jgi:hypothetical protein
MCLYAIDTYENKISNSLLEVSVSEKKINKNDIELGEKKSLDQGQSATANKQNFISL